MEVPERSEIGFLDNVLGLRPVVGQPERSLVERVQVDEGDLFELPVFPGPFRPAEQSPSLPVLTISTPARPILFRCVREYRLGAGVRFQRL